MINFQSPQSLSFQSTLTAMKLYSCNWQGKPTDIMFQINHSLIDKNTMKKIKNIIECPIEPKLLKELTFVIKRAQKPLIITAAKFAVFSLTSFTKVCANDLFFLVSLTRDRLISMETFYLKTKLCILLFVVVNFIIKLPFFFLFRF